MYRNDRFMVLLVFVTLTGRDDLPEAHKVKLVEVGLAPWLLGLRGVYAPFVVREGRGAG